jgi:hypothetical protein
LWSIGAYLTALRCYIKLGRCPLVLIYLESFLIGAVPGCAPRDALQPLWTIQN